MVGALLAVGAGNLSPQVIAHKLALGKTQLPGMQSILLCGMLVSQQQLSQQQLSQQQTLLNMQGV